MNKNPKLTPAQERWLAALESGKYQQTRHKLQDRDGYCCLGVACLVSDAMVTKHAVTGAFLGHGLSKSQQGVFKELRMTHFGERDLFEANDHEKLGFIEIAAYVRDDPAHFFCHPDSTMGYVNAQQPEG